MSLKELIKISFWANNLLVWGSWKICMKSTSMLKLLYLTYLLRFAEINKTFYLIIEINNIKAEKVLKKAINKGSPINNLVTPIFLKHKLLTVLLKRFSILFLPVQKKINSIWGMMKTHHLKICLCNKSLTITLTDSLSELIQSTWIWWSIIFPFK